MEIPEQCHVDHHVQHPTARHCNHRSRNQRESNNNNNNTSRGYKHHYTFMATMVDPNLDSPGDDDESVHTSRAPVQTPGTNQKFFPMEMEDELYKENRKSHSFMKTRQLLASDINLNGELKAESECKPTP